MALDITIFRSNDYVPSFFLQVGLDYLLCRTELNCLKYWGWEILTGHLSLGLFQWPDYLI